MQNDVFLKYKFKIFLQISNLKKAREALEGRVVELQLKADRVQVVETEKKSL